MLKKDEHKCHKHGKNFDILMMATPLVDLKTLLKLGPKIDSFVVDQVVREIGWTEPANPTMEPPTKRRGSQGQAPRAHFDNVNPKEVRSVVVKPKETVPKLKDLENVCPPNVPVHHPVPSPVCDLIILIWGHHLTFIWTLRRRT